MALLVLTLIRDDLLQNWKTSLPPDAPNRFLVNIQKDQLQPLEVFFKENAISPPPVFPMVRGRLTGINGKNIVPGDFTDTRAKRLIEREFNLSWAREMSPDNLIVKGQWWGEVTPESLSSRLRRGLLRRWELRSEIRSPMMLQGVRSLPA